MSQTVNRECTADVTAGAPEVRRLLCLADGLHEHVLDDDVDVGAGEAVGAAAQLLELRHRERMRRVAQVHLEHVRPCRQLRQRNVDALGRGQEKLVSKTTNCQESRPGAP